jgi:hypothetical protein
MFVSIEFLSAGNSCRKRKRKRCASMRMTRAPTRLLEARDPGISIRDAMFLHFFPSSGGILSIREEVQAVLYLLVAVEDDDEHVFSSWTSIQYENFLFWKSTPKNPKPSPLQPLNNW